MIYALLGGGFLLYHLFFLIRIQRMAREGKEALRATEAMCDATKEFFEWLDDPLSNHSDAEFRERVRKIIRAEKKFADTHPKIDMERSIVRWNEYIDTTS